MLVVIGYLGSHRSLSKLSCWQQAQRGPLTSRFVTSLSDEGDKGWLHVKTWHSFELRNESSVSHKLRSNLSLEMNIMERESNDFVIMIHVCTCGVIGHTSVSIQHSSMGIKVNHWPIACSMAPCFLCCPAMVSSLYLVSKTAM